MSSYPGLHPSGFVEIDSDYSGQRLYRSQPSRESKGILLNEYMEKYNVGQYKGGDFLRLATDLKSMSRQWNRLPDDIKRQFVSLMLNSDSDLSKDLLKELSNDLSNDLSKDSQVEHFGEDAPAAVPDKPCNNGNIFILIIVAIASLVIGFLVAFI